MTASDPVPSTGFTGLDSVLGELVDRAAGILADDFVGAYLQGSFALGDADFYSDCDFVVVTRRPVSNAQFDTLAVMHSEFPRRDGHWTKHLEGSYAVLDELRSLQAVGREWPFIDHGSDQLEWSTHCNSAVVRWTLRECGVVLAGPDPITFIDVVSGDDLRSSMRALIPGLVPGFLTWASFELAWAQRYLVCTICRVLCTLDTGRVVSKRQAMMWALANLEARWHPLIQLALDERQNLYDPSHVAEPAVSAETRALADALGDLASRFGSGP